MDAKTTKPKIVPFSLKDSPSLIERVWPAQKISVEAQKERKAGPGQTLTALGSYWKGRKPLVLVSACVLGALLPATDDEIADLEVFDLLMGMADEQVEGRLKGPISIDDVLTYGSPAQIASLTEEVVVNGKANRKFRPIPRAEYHSKMAAVIARAPYVDRMAYLLRPEEIDTHLLIDTRLDKVNEHLGTSASSLEELIEQLGIMRFGRRPLVGDTFCGGGSIPFAAARMGCSTYASDLSPIAAMLTWASINIIGAGLESQRDFEQLQQSVIDGVDREITNLGIEHDRDGNRAKTYLYCLETRCPQTGWMVPLSTTWVISARRNVIARLSPDRTKKRFNIKIETDVLPAAMDAAAKGTIQGRDLVYELDGEIHRIPVATLRGDYRRSGGKSGNQLRKWEKSDFKPRPDDIFQERLYCIHWMTKESLAKGRQETFFTAVTDEDLKRDRKVEDLVRDNLAAWQSAGVVPDMRIEPGENTSQPIRERGWTYWHHLFSTRHLLALALIGRACREDARLMVSLAGTLDFMSKLTRWVNSGREGGGTEFTTNVFSNQALNTFFNWGEGAFRRNQDAFLISTKHFSIDFDATIVVHDAKQKQLNVTADIFITDPPYADAVNYDEITEYFIAWLRKNPPKPFDKWVWDSHRSLAIKGEGDEFRHNMVEAYKAMADHMPDNGIQIVMFTHQSASVWADMAQIFWGAGLQVMAAWYIATETNTELKKGGYVQGTVILALRKRKASESGYKDEVVQEVKAEVAEQIDTMVGLNQSLRGHGRVENLFEDADLQMAGYAAALRVLTKYEKIDGTDMTKEALRPRRADEKNLVGEIVEFAVQVANEHMVPEYMPPKVWERLSGPERFYFKMMDIETTALRKLDNYQNFAKAFRVGDYGAFMGSMEPNKARLKSAKQFKKSGFDIHEFGPSATRAALYAIFELEDEVEGDDVLSHLKDLLPNYHSKRDDLVAIADYIARKRASVDEAESRAARILYGLIRNERLG
jgi:putative DNA methylase